MAGVNEYSISFLLAICCKRILISSHRRTVVSDALEIVVGVQPGNRQHLLPRLHIGAVLSWLPLECRNLLFNGV